MTEPVLTLKMLEDALKQMDEIVCPAVTLESIPFLAMRLQTEWEMGVAAGRLKPEDLEPWTRAKMAEVFGADYVRPERIPIYPPIGPSERERGKWRRRR